MRPAAAEIVTGDAPVALIACIVCGGIGSAVNLRLDGPLRALGDRVSRSDLVVGVLDVAVDLRLEVDRVPGVTLLPPL